MVTVKASNMVRRLTIATGIWCLVAASGIVSAQDVNWGLKMFDRQVVDFGNVAKGADAKVRIKVRNLYQETIQVTSANTSCACFKAGMVDNVTQIASNQTAELEVSVNTINYQRKRDATLIVNLLEPSKRSMAEVRIPLHAYIRTDVVFTPGAVNFGNLDLGSGAKQIVKVAYAGRNDWQIREVKSSNTHMVTSVKETGRANGLVNYELTVELKPETPVGSMRDQITLVTDDAKDPQVPLLVFGAVEADVTLTPDVLTFGTLSPGQTKTMNLVIRAKKPFTIQKIEREKGDDAFRVKLPEDAKPVHVLPITLVTPTEPGAFDEVFSINIAGRSEAITFRAQGKIVPQAAPNAN